MPVTVESLRATKRASPDDSWSSYAGRFVWRVTMYVIISLFVMLGLYILVYEYLEVFATQSGGISTAGIRIQWIAFGCIGALAHLLNYALTATRLQTFEVSEARKIGPRILLGGLFGFIVPWMTSSGEQVKVEAHRFNAEGPQGLRDRPRSGRPRQLTEAQIEELADHWAS